jgi:hypothetical protein
MTLAERLNDAEAFPKVSHGDVIVWQPDGNGGLAEVTADDAYVDENEDGEKVVRVEVGGETAEWSLERGEPVWGMVNV